MDQDGDGFGSGNATYQCSAPDESYVLFEGDCDDNNPDIHPEVIEICDGIDNNCNNLYDEDDPTISYTSENMYYSDSDNDGFGNPSAQTHHCQVQEGETDIAGDCDDDDPFTYPGAAPQDSVFGCMTDQDGDGFGSDSPTGSVLVGTDCDDFHSTSFPNASEICDYTDNDCDGSIDEGSSFFYPDTDNDGYGDVSTYSCSMDDGFITNSGDCDDTDDSISPIAEEICDTIDNNCNALVDEGVKVEFYNDGDGDGFGDPLSTALACYGSPPTGYVYNNVDCDDGRNDISPLNDELCDGIDNDCDGTIDESDALNVTQWYIDNDLDTYGTNAAIVTACNAPSGYTDNAQDCDDTMYSTNPGASEIIGNENDDDCDGIEYCYDDLDNDGFSEGISYSPSQDLDCQDASEASMNNLGDCNDLNSMINPSATEIVGDNLDSNCNGEELCFVDTDGDAFRTIDTSLIINSIDTDCLDSGESSLTSPATDCDDLNSTIYPGAIELVGNTVDEDCDGTVLCFVDMDGDNFRNINTTLHISSSDLDCFDLGEAEDSLPPTDCNDSVASVYPNAPETIANNSDDDCDGFEYCYTDNDNDGYIDAGAIQSTDYSCTSGLLTFIPTDIDCNDNDSAIFPNQPPVCLDGILDNDCNPSTLCLNDEASQINHHEIVYSGSSDFGATVIVNDGILAIGQTNIGGGEVYLFSDPINANNEQDADVTLVPTINGQFGNSIVMGDWNGNGVYGNAIHDEANSLIYIAETNSQTSPLSTIITQGLNPPFIFSTVDINNDGTTEVVVYLENEYPNLYFIQDNSNNQYLQNSNQCFSGNNGISGINVNWNIHQFQSLDINGDGFLDMAYGRPGKVYAYVEDGGLCLDSYPELRFDGSTSGFGSAMKFGDLDGDGNQDLAAADPTEGIIYTFLTSEWGGAFDGDTYKSNDTHSIYLLEEYSGDFNGLSIEIMGDGRIVTHFEVSNRTSLYSLPSTSGTLILNEENADVNYFDYLSNGLSGHNGIISRLEDIDSSGQEDLLLSAPSGLDSQGMGGRVIILLDP